MAIVYQHRRMDTNEVFYVGIGVDKKRPYDKNNRNKYWINIVKKCKEYEVEILHENISYQECKIIEIDLIDKYGRKDLGTGTLCNLTNGGDGTSGIVFSEEHKRKMSESAKGKTISQETRKKISELKTGEKHPFFGKKHSDETIRKMSEAQKGKKHSDESRRKMSESAKGKTSEQNPMFGKKHLDETIRKMSEAQKGKKRSEETIRKMIETKRKNRESLDN
jgi:hypothetical protein